MSKRPQTKLPTFNGFPCASGHPEHMREAQEITSYVIAGKSYQRVPYGSEGEDWGAEHGPCHDCLAIEGQYHALGCDVERCPACGGQSISCNCPDEDGVPDGHFDFRSHSQEAIATYAIKRRSCEDFCNVLRIIIGQSLTDRGIQINSIDVRAKDLESFGAKAGKPSEDDPTKPKYKDPIREITDICGCRIIAFSPASLAPVETLIIEEFDVLERSDKSETLRAEEKFGYQSLHYIVKLSEKRAALPEYKPFVGMVAEIQVRTILQHAWAAIEHKVGYKSTIVVPADIRRRFAALAGLLEIADREFQEIMDANGRLRTAAQASIEQGVFSKVEITPDALMRYLTRRLGPDRRVKWGSYERAARLLRELGFGDIQQLDDCLGDMDIKEIGRTAFNPRLGPIWKLEAGLIARMGMVFAERHLLRGGDFPDIIGKIIFDFESAGIAVGSYDPRALRETPKS